MFVIASSGRCGTLALCRGLDEYSDHRVEHEPEPRLLREAYLKHVGAEYHTDTYRERLAFFRERDGTSYGQSFRAPTLLEDVAQAAPGARILILVRHPLEYVLSANFMNVLRRGDEWDELRIMPAGAESLSLAERLVLHWAEVNRYLLAFVEDHPRRARLAIAERLEEKVLPISEHLGVRVESPGELQRLLAARPNASEAKEPPDGFERIADGGPWEQAWRRASALSAF